MNILDSSNENEEQSDKDSIRKVQLSFQIDSFKSPRCSDSVNQEEDLKEDFEALRESTLNNNNNNERYMKTRNQKYSSVQPKYNQINPKNYIAQSRWYNFQVKQQETVREQIWNNYFRNLANSQKTTQRNISRERNEKSPKSCHQSEDKVKHFKKRILQSGAQQMRKFVEKVTKISKDQYRQSLKFTGYEKQLKQIIIRGTVNKVQYDEEEDENSINNKILTRSKLLSEQFPSYKRYLQKRIYKQSLNTTIVDIKIPQEVQKRSFDYSKDDAKRLIENETYEYLESNNEFKDIVVNVSKMISNHKKYFISKK